MTDDVPVNGQQDQSIDGNQELRVLAQAISALARAGDLGERLAKLEEWKALVQRPAGYLTRLESRLESLERWKENETTETAGKKQRKRNWVRELAILVVGFALATISAWLSGKWGPPPTPPGPTG